MTETFTHAKFWRCALQVNPAKYSATYRGTAGRLTEDAYNEAILQRCLRLGIGVVGVADHACVESVDRLRSCLNAHRIVVFPGFEIASTEKVHMVCLFAESTTKDQLNRYLGKLDLTDVENGVLPSKLGCLELAKTIEELRGFWYAAHATGANGLLRLQSKDGGGLTHVWKEDRHVRVAQVPGSREDLPENYRQIIDNRNPDYRRERPIVLINAKDVAKPEDLEAPSATCLIKMTQPTFDAFKVAFLDPESRVRLHSELKDEPHSELLSVSVRGGYLDGVVVELSAHLNAVIGGRGTGKSTLLECLRYALEVSPKGKQASKLSQDIVKQNLGSSGTVAVKLRSAAQHGKTFTVSRRYGEPAFVIDSDGNTSQLRPRDLLPAIEFYGQNEIYELAQDSSSRLQLLERFLPADHDAARLREQLRKRLQENQQKLVKTLVDLDEVKGQVALLPKLTEQLQGYQSLGLETKLAKTPLLARERQLEERVRQELLRVEEALSTLGDSLPDSTFLSEKSLEGLPNREHLAPMRQVLENLRRVLEQRLAELKAVLQASTAETTTHVSAWRLALQADEDELRRAVAALPNMAGKTGREVGAAFQALSQQIERIKPLGARDLALTQLRTSLLQERANLRREQSEFRSARASALQHAVAALNKRLRGKLQVKLTAERDRGPLKTFLLGCRLDGIGERRLTWVDERDELTPLGLADAIREGQAKLMSQYSLPPGTAEALTKLSYTQLMELEALELEDIVDIELNVAHGENELYRSLERLSTGQQCTAVLHMLLLDNADPLVVDQPEDNLDNAFIAERIVRELRRAKTSRQFLFSTHNANIPVFGDAEWIGIFTADDRHGSLSRDQQGSIDVPAIRTQVADILEGGRAAFMQRKEKYEF